MKDRTVSSWRIVTIITTATAFIFAIGYALTGYLVFGEKAEGKQLETVSKQTLIRFLLSIKT